MLLSEEEAKTKWCPKYQVGGDADNRPLAQGPDGKLARYSPDWSACCMGSGCMAWRWSDPTNQHGERLIVTDGRRGYCGIAGKPE